MHSSKFPKVLLKNKKGDTCVTRYDLSIMTCQLWPAICKPHEKNASKKRSTFTMAIWKNGMWRSGWKLSIIDMWGMQFGVVDHFLKKYNFLHECHILAILDWSRGAMRNQSSDSGWGMLCEYGGIGFSSVKCLLRVINRVLVRCCWEAE